MADIDQRTGLVIQGIDSVYQSLELIFNTPQASRAMREWMGNPGLALLGENATERTFMLYFNITYLLVTLFEPRFRILRFLITDITRDGFADFTILGEYRPYAHLDWVQAEAFVSVVNGIVTVGNPR